MTGTALVEKFDFGSVTNFDPSVFKEELAKVDAIKDLAIKLKDRTMLQTAAAFRAAKVTQAVVHYKGVVRSPDEGRPEKCAPDRALSPEIAKELGFSNRTLQEWAQKVYRKEADGTLVVDREKYALTLLTAWMKTAGMLEDAVSGGGGGGGSAGVLDKFHKLVPQATQAEIDQMADELEPLRSKPKIVKGTKKLPKPSYSDDDFTGIVEQPKDHRVAKAVELFFNGTPVDKRVWLQQRMEEQPTPLKGTGPHVDWIQAYWKSDPDVQWTIREEIKIENSRRMEG